MSKYDLLWKYIKSTNQEKLILSYSKIEEILGFKIDHSFLSYKKELLEYDYQVDKISMKKEEITFIKIKD